MFHVSLLSDFMLTFLVLTHFSSCYSEGTTELGATWDNSFTIKANIIGNDLGLTTNRWTGRTDISNEGMFIPLAYSISLRIFYLSFYMVVLDG